MCCCWQLRKRRRENGPLSFPVAPSDRDGLLKWMSHMCKEGWVVLKAWLGRPCGNWCQPRSLRQVALHRRRLGCCSGRLSLCLGNKMLTRRRREKKREKKRGIGIMRQKAQKQSEGNCGFCSKKQLLITCGHGFWATTKVWCLYLIHIPCRLLLLLLRFKNNYKFTVISTVHYEVQQWCAFLHSLVLLVFEWPKTKVLTLPWEVRGQVQLGGLQRDSQAQFNADKSWHLWERWAQSLCMKNRRCHHRVT